MQFNFINILARFCKCWKYASNTEASKVSDYSSFEYYLSKIKTNSYIERIGGLSLWSHILVFVVLLSLMFFAYITLNYIGQPLADVHATRQTQTALTSYWMLQDGWKLAYQTPVVGYPWSIPFEFPIYQSIVALIAVLTGLDLGVIGRFVSFVFLVACAWPALAISRRFNLPNSVPLVFCALLWTSPLNVYWGRTFMIETTALFFSLACIPFAIDFIRRINGWHSVLMFILFATAAVLQKATTGGPVLLFLLLSVFYIQVKKGISVQAIKESIVPVMIISVPLVIGLFWAHYTDTIKIANAFGNQLTSDALKLHNFGSLEQRMTWETWRQIIWERSLNWSTGGWFALLLLLLPWFGKNDGIRQYKPLFLASIALFLLPLMIFTNLHYVHEYYQVANTAYLILALAIVIGGWLRAVTGMMLVVLLVTGILIAINISFFSKTYGVVVKRSIEELDSRSVLPYKVGRYLREHTRAGTGLVVFGQGYNSQIAYESERKTMAVPSWFIDYKHLWEFPDSYLGDVELSAIVICPVTSDFPNKKDIMSRLEIEKKWIHRTYDSCEILFTPNGLVDIDKE